MSKSPKVAKTFRLEPKTATWIDKKVAKERRSNGAIIDILVEKEIAREAENTPQPQVLATVTG